MIAEFVVFICIAAIYCVCSWFNDVTGKKGG